MTEAEWLQCDDPHLMLAYMCDIASDRKFRLLVCGLCRRIGYLLHDRVSRRALEVAELFADDVVEQAELARNHRFAWEVWELCPRMNPLVARAAGAVALATKPELLDDEALQVLTYSLTAEARKDTEEARRDRCVLFRCLFGNPFRPIAVRSSWLSWRDGAIPRLARAIYDEQRFYDMPELLAALEEAGCDSTELLAHCRQSEEHVRGCWVVDLLLHQE